MSAFYLAGNWKMNTSLDEALALFSEVRTIAEDELPTSDFLLLFPPFPFLYSIKQLNHTRISIGAQNISWEDKGAFTGEVSARMLQSVGASHVILGHSERRTYFGEDDEMLLKKMQVALHYRLKPIFCVGETKTERENGLYLDRIKNQLERVLFNFKPSELAGLIIAYEPVWAIGTGLNATPTEAEEVHASIREMLSDAFGRFGAEISILYGGSCNTSNAAALFSQKNIDGGLIGGASLKARDFIELAKMLLQIRRTKGS